VLTYFNASSTKIGGIERDVQLSEHLLRVLVVCADGMTPDLMEAAMTAQRRGTEEGSDRDRADSESYSDDDRRPRRSSFREPAAAGRDD